MDSVALRSLGACFKQGNPARNAKVQFLKMVFGFHLSRLSRTGYFLDIPMAKFPILRRPRFIRVTASDPRDAEIQTHLKRSIKTS